MCVCLYILCHLAVQLTCVCCLCGMYEVNYPPWTGATNVAICSLLRRYDSLLSTHTHHHKSIYIFRKTKMADNHLRIFATCYSGVAYLCTSFPLGYSTVDAPGAWKIWWLFSNGHMWNSKQLIWTPPYNVRYHYTGAIPYSPLTTCGSTDAIATYYTLHVHCMWHVAAKFGHLHFHWLRLLLCRHLLEKCWTLQCWQ